MKTKRTRWWLKSAALLCATVFGLTAFGDYWNDWRAEGGVGYWEDASSWTYGTVADGTLQWRVGYDGAAVKFKTAAAPEAGELHLHGGTATFTADASETDVVNGLTVGVANVGVWYGGAATAEFTSGAYNFTTLNVGRWSNAGTVNINGGTVYAGTIWNGVTNGDTGATTAGSVTLTSGELKLGAGGIFSDPAGTFTIAGGTLTAIESTSWLVNGTAMVVNGGTINTDYDVTILSALTGSGTLTKTGTGTLTITGSISAFKGKISVEAGAGSVIVGDVTIAAGEEVQFGVYTWTGAANDDLWATPGNWLVNNAVPTAPPAADSVVVIPEGDGTALTVTCAGATDFTGDLTIDRDVTFTGSGISLGTVSGTGTLTVDAGADNTFNFTGNGTIKTELSVENGLYCGTAKITLNGALTGTGSISFDNKSNAVPGLVFKGDTSGFGGTYSASSRDHGDRDGTTFDGSALGSENAAWRFGNDDSSKQAYTPFKHVDGLEYKFGSLVTVGKDAKWAAGGEQGYGRLSMHYRASSQDRYIKNTTFKVGALEGSTSNIGGTLYNGTTASTTNPNKIVKVGDSTAYIRLTSNDGLVEVNEGTVYIAAASDSVAYAPVACTITGTGATVTVEDAVGTWQKVIDTEAVADDPETEEDETVEEASHQELVAKFVPVLSAEFLDKGYQLNAADGEGSSTYTIPYVAKDASDTEYYSVADAIEALDEAQDKTVTLIRNTTEEVALPLNYTLVMAGFTAGSVAGIPGVAVEYNEETGTYTTVDNSKATWQGAAAGANWADADNWSTRRLPDAGTAVTFTGNATVFLADNNTYDCGSIYISRDDATVTFAPVDYNESNWPRVKVYGNIGAHGDCVLKLYRCGIDNGTDGRITVRPTVTFENTTGDSWFTGNFDLQAGLNGTGEFRIYGGTIHFATGSGITVNAGSVVDFRNYYPTFEGRSGTLYSTGVNGDGRIIVHALPTSSTLTYFQNAFKNANNWTGTCELAGVSISGIDAANYGNANSTVCFNGVSGYLRYSSGSTTEVGKVKTIEIGANGLTLNNGFTSGTFGYIIAADITGSGPIHFGTRHNNAAVGQYFLTGSLDGFTGAIDFGDLQSYRPAVIIKDASTYAPAVNDYGQIIVAAERTVTVSGAWNAPGGFVVLGNVNVASTGSITSTNGLCGNGTVTYAAIPATAPGCFAGGTSSGTNREIPAWTGTVVLPARTGSGAVALAGLGRTGSKIVVNGITGTDANSIYLSDASAINGTVELKGDVKFTNGSTGANYTFAEVTGTGNMFLSATGSSGSPYYTYTFTKLTDYTGEINAVKTSDSKYAALAINTVAVSEVVPGTPVVKLAANSNLTTDPAAIALEVGGEATEARLFKADDGNLYVAVASVTVTPEEGDPVTTLFATYEAAAAFADENSVTEFTVLYGDGVMNGWDYDSAAGTLTKNTTAIARVGATQYDTLEAAFEAASAGDTVVLFGTSDEAVALAADGATLEIDTTATYTGALSGDGTVVANKDLTPVFSGWTGTFVMNWDTSVATSGTGWELGKYGVSGSTVVVAQPIANGYLKEVNKSAPPSIAPAVYLKANVSLTDGYAGSGQTTTFAELGADEGVTFSFRYLAGAQEKDKTYYTITKLNNFDGTLVLNPYNQVVVNAVELDATPAVGTKVVNATVDATASLTGKIADGYPLVFKADGLYFDPVAKVGEVYYNTLADAIAAANGAVVTLVQSTEEGYTFTGAGTVKIQFNGQTCGTIAAPEGAYVFSVAWQEETTTATYTCRVAAASASIGGVVTYYSTVQEAYLAVNANGSVGDSFTVLDGTDYGTLEGFSYDAETATYTKIATIAQFTFGVHTYSFTTLASACATAEEYDPIPTVTLLVALGEQTVPEGWEYNTPEASETEFGTLTKVVAPQPITVDTDGCDFTVDATTAAAIAAATGVDTTKANFGKAAIAYVVGGELEDGEVVIPTPTIKVSGTTVTVVYDSETANADAYTVTCTLYSFSLADANDSSKWTTVATGEIGDELKDTGASAANKFYKVGVTVGNKQLVSEEVEEGTGA